MESMAVRLSRLNLHARRNRERLGLVPSALNLAAHRAHAEMRADGVMESINTGIGNQFIAKYIRRQAISVHQLYAEQIEVRATKTEHSVPPIVAGACRNDSRVAEIAER